MVVVIVLEILLREAGGADFVMIGVNVVDECDGEYIFDTIIKFQLV